MNIDDIKDMVNLSKEKFESLIDIFEEDKLSEKITEIENEINGMQTFDVEKSKYLNKKKKFLEIKLNKISEMKTFFSSLKDYYLLLEEDDGSLLLEFENEAKKVCKMVEDFWIETLLGEKFDNESAVLTVHSGAGGEEAQDWAEMIARLYQRYAEKQGYYYEIVDIMPGDGAGIKSETMIIEGDKAYGFLKCESGVHRLVRLSPFDSNNRRHTSFASVEVSPLVKENEGIEINPKDLKIDTYRSSGAGGQHVNKTESAVRITHIPTKIVVACQNERSQIQNREKAMQILTGKLSELKEKEKREAELKARGESKKIEWGSQIRSYVLHPYNMVKDHRTGMETSDTISVLDGDIQEFINEFLKKRVENENK